MIRNSFLCISVMSAAAWLASPVLAQLTTNAPPPKPAVATLPPEIVSLITKDGVQLTLTHFPSVAAKGTPAAKQVAPVVLLHDYKDTRAIYDSLAARLQAAADPNTARPYFDIVSLDLRAHGDTSIVGEAGAFTFGAMAGDIIALLGRLGLRHKPVYVAGVSMGAALALRLAMDGHLDVRGLALVRPAMSASPNPANLASLPLVARLLRERTTEEAMDALVASPEYQAIVAVSDAPFEPPPSPPPASALPARSGGCVEAGANPSGSVPRAGRTPGTAAAYPARSANIRSACRSPRALDRPLAGHARLTIAA